MQAPKFPLFRFHPDPIQSGSVIPSGATCCVCHEARGHIYAGPIYGECDEIEALCPWCIADGSAHQRYEVTFHEADLAGDPPPEVREEIDERTPGFATFNPIEWPACCQSPMAYLEPVGIAEIRARHYTLEGGLMGRIVHELGLSGGAANRFLESFRRDTSPTVHVFHCLQCDTKQGVIDSL